ncbi:MAG: glycosyltransferase [Candidatus Pacearchaeota archaeon]
MNYLFEISWEVCNKVGGIYTVISSKSKYAKKICKNYFFIGPYFNNKDFSEEEPPEEFRKIFESLTEKKIKIHYGRWGSIDSYAILIDFKELMREKNYIKTVLWEYFKVDSIRSGFEFDEPVVWAWAVGMFLGEFSKTRDKIVAQFHEWLSGAGILYLKKFNSNVATVFTTHATVLERAMASEKKIYVSGNPEDEASKRGIIDKHSLERESALNCDVFTTVSNLISESAEKIFGRKPEVLVYNGIDIRKYDFSKSRKKIEFFVKSYFYPYYYLEIKNTDFYFISGRYEILSKGIDVFVKSLGRLNKKLKEEGSKKNIIAFILIPAATKRVNDDVIKNFLLFSRINEKISDNFRLLRKKIINYVLFKKESDMSLSDEVSRSIRVFKKRGHPPLATHELIHDDAIMKFLAENGLGNREDDKVKVIYYPAYLEEGDGLLNLDYYEFTKGFDLGIFPSFYEPWGYTPLESISLGVPAIASDLSGFGDFIDGKKETGIIIANRKNKNDDEIVDQLRDEMHEYLNLKKLEKMKNKIMAENFGKKFSWKYLIENYLKAYRLAIKKKEDNL